VNRLVFLVPLAVILRGVSPLGISHTSASIANTTISDTDTSSVATEAESTSANASASATITITMTGALNE
jgi:hypothetical protein